MDMMVQHFGAPAPVPLIPDTAPFTAEQRAWLNGFLAGLYGGAAAGAPAAAPAPEPEDYPWHDPALDLPERLASAGCALQNMLLMATALGYGSALTSGKALKSNGLRTLFGLRAGEQALCFVSLGTVQSRKPARVRPAVADYFSTLGGV